MATIKSVHESADGTLKVSIGIVELIRCYGGDNWPLVTLIATLIFPAMAFGASVPAEPTIAVQSDVHVEAASFGTAPLTMSSSDTASIAAPPGTENGNCPTENRRSQAQAAASVRIDQGPTSGVKTANFDVATSAVGGHIATCVSILGMFGGKSGVDTSATATGRAKVSFSVSTSTDANAPRYNVQIQAAPPSAGTLTMEVSDDEDKIVDHWNASTAQLDANNEGGAHTFTIGPGFHQSYTVTGTFFLSASNTGGCCSDVQRATSQVLVNVTREQPGIGGETIETVGASIFRPHPLIQGGAVEVKFAPVGALITSNTLCTGTVIGKITVLTAAHCVRGINKETLTFVVGGNAYNAPDYQTWHVRSYAFPVDQKTGFAYDELIYADDIALVYVDKPFEYEDPNHVKSSVPPMKIYDGTPNLTDLQQAGTRLYFVGFGYSDPTGKDPLGLKRSVSMTPTRVAAKTFKNDNAGQSTCEGDSGGPSFLRGASEADAKIVGVVSHGYSDEFCQGEGINTRADAYASWILSRIDKPPP